mgnify:CR=1 FL=1|jgi:hypothetical protein
MRIKQQKIYDINSDEFIHLKREENRILHRVDINELNKRLNETRKSNFYATTLIVSICLFGLVVLSFIGLKF